MGKEKVSPTKVNHVVTIPIPRPVIQLGGKATTTGVVSGVEEGGAPQSGTDREVTYPLAPHGQEGVAAPPMGRGLVGNWALQGPPQGQRARPRVGLVGPL